MKQLMEYKIISGRTVEIRRSYLSVRSGSQPKKRGLRRAGASSMKKILANKLSSARRLAQKINVNFHPRDGWVTLKYDAAHLPPDFEAAVENMNKFLRVLRREYRKRKGHAPLIIWETANWSPKRKAPARLHQHMVVPADAIDLVRQLWRGGSVITVELDGSGDYSAIASYMEDNVHGRPQKKKWHCSRGMAEPIYTEPVPVSDVEGIQPEKGSIINAHDKSVDEDGVVVSTYLRCTLPEAPRVRGGQIYMTRRGGRKNE